MLALSFIIFHDICIDTSTVDIRVPNGLTLENAQFVVGKLLILDVYFPITLIFPMTDQGVSQYHMFNE